MQIQAELKSIHSTYIDDLKAFAPTGPFGLSVRILVGPKGGQGEESFDVMLCTPDWFAANMEGPIISGRHFLFVQNYKYQSLENYIRAYCLNCVGTSWQEVAEKLSRLGKWEFEDYQP